jgi:Predicted membrane protein (DUF2142)
MRRERNLILLLCTLAALRVLAFSAAFPFFNNVDEQAHVDLVMKYARGQLPRDLGSYSSESAHYFSLYGSPEYFTAPQQFAANDFPQPNWSLPAEQRDDATNKISSWWQSNENHESGEPPLYYAVAGAWLNLGRLFGIRNGWSLYWVRFLNVPLAAVLVWLGFVAARVTFSDSRFLRLTVPALLAIWPQTTLYSIASDSLSPLCFGVAFIGLVKLLQPEKPTIPLAIWTGLALAATCLIKTTNLILLLIAGMALMFKIRDACEDKTLRPLVGPLAVLIASAAVPIALWLIWNVYNFGNLTATRSKIEFLGWSRKPIVSWLPHPIFTLSGLKEFWTQLIPSFWRGEFIWHGQRLSSRIGDAFYWISSTLAIVLTALLLLCRPAKFTRLQRQSLWLAWFSFCILILFVAVLSIAFDFGLCVYPSREHPYFTSGRLLAAAAVPFFLCYSVALQIVLSWIPRMWPRVIAFAGILLFIVLPQSVLNWRAFSSRYNLFHLNRDL